MQHWYQCPYCGNNVAYGQPGCSRCGNGLQWQQPQPPPPTSQYQSPPQYQQQFQQPQFQQPFQAPQQQTYQNHIKTRGNSGLKIAALILGIIGGLAGFMGAIFALVVGGIGSAFKASGAETVVGLGWAAIPISLVGIIGGAMAMAKPKIAGIIMLLSGIAGFIAISGGYLLGGPLLIVGGVLALVASRK